MIRFEHLSKTFQTKDGAFEALKDVSFEIEKGDIYGVIGYSGAGKSTLIRMITPWKDRLPERFLSKIRTLEA